MKLLSRDHDVFKFKVVANMVRSPKEGQQLFAKLSKVSDRFLDVALELVGVVPFDENIRKSVRKQQAIVEAFPESPAAKAFKSLAKKIAQWPVPHHASGHLEFFIEQLLEN
jgi:flagellar biosynthesis protein FlhG